MNLAILPPKFVTHVGIHALVYARVYHYDANPILADSHT